MPGEPLVCVWEAAKVSAPNNNITNLTVDLLKDVTSKFQGLTSVDYTDSKFKATLACHDEVRFTDYKAYVHTVLRKADVPLLLFLEQIEKKCWEMCKNRYISHQTSGNVVEMVWQIFNRYADESAFPAVIPRDRTLLFLNNLSEKLGIKLKKSKLSLDKGVTFDALLKIFDDVIFCESDKAKLLSVITNINGKLTKKIIKSGWMFKRSKHISNWTGWTKRWFVLTSENLTYYVKGCCADPDGCSKEGEISITPQTKLEPLPPYNGAFKKYSGRFKVTLSRMREIEMSAECETERKFWLEGIHEVMNDEALRKQASFESGPKDLGQVVIQKENQKNVSFAPGPKDFRQVVIQKNKQHNLKSCLLEPEKGKQDICINIHKPIEDENNKPENVVNLEEEKLKVIFLKIDKDGNGFVDEIELIEFFNCIGLSLSEADAKQVFQKIDTDKSSMISFEEFARYFERVMFKEDCGDRVENKLRSAFLSADRDGSGTINFKEFVEYVWEKKRSVRMSKLLKTFHKMEQNEEGEVPYNQFRQCLETELEDLGIIQEENENEETDGHDGLNNMLKSLYDETDSEELAAFIKDRWKTFASFKRLGASGDIVMKGSHDMVGDFTPGDYSLMDLACFSDVPPIEPKHTVIKGAKWMGSTEAGKSGKCIFPAYFDGKVVSDIATNETLRYYDCSFANGNQVKISLLYRHGIQDFTYENKYLDDYVKNQNGGSGVEKHEFSHLDCPLEDDSGYFILAKFHTKDELHVTAFRIPARHTLYIPGGVIHSNDYLKGRWRTMLSDEAQVDHVHLVQPKSKTTYKHFTFTFV